MIYEMTQNKMRQMALDWISPDEKHVVELGCSNGNFAELLYYRGITNYIGIDILKDKISEAKTKLPGMLFMCCDITDNLYMLEKATTFVSFQCLEHIKDDLKVINSLKEDTNVILSVPNSPYKGHVRWFELNGWTKRYRPYIHFEARHTIQNPKKVDKRSFLFKGVRNDHKD
jgi:SAM-dependent methyltransferase